MIKKILFATLLVENFFLASSFGYSNFYKKPPVPVSVSSSLPAAEVPPSSPQVSVNLNRVTNASDAGVPTKVYIPKMGITAEIESVGLALDGRMDVTKDVYNVGWYMYGPKPGQVGSAVMTGHFDTPTGAPSVFYNLYKLKPGDEFSVQDDLGTVRQFVVEKSVIHPDDNFPIDEVFSQNDAARLNLITCMGTFDKATKTYSHRLVVYSKLKE